MLAYCLGVEEGLLSGCYKGLLLGVEEGLLYDCRESSAVLWA